MSSDCVSGRVVPCQRRCCWLYFARSRADASATRNGLYKRRISRKQTPKLVLFTASSPALRNFLNVAWLGISIAKLPLWRLQATIQVERNRSHSTIELVKPPSEFPLFAFSALRQQSHARECEHPGYHDPARVARFAPFSTTCRLIPAFRRVPLDSRFRGNDTVGTKHLFRAVALSLPARVARW